MSMTLSPTGILWGLSRLVPRMVPPMVRMPESAPACRSDGAILHKATEALAETDDAHVILADSGLAQRAMAAFNPGLSPPAVRNSD